MRVILPSGSREYPLLLGYTTEGSEVAVLELDKAEAYIDPCLLEVMSDPDLDRHFILKCKVRRLAARIFLKCFSFFNVCNIVKTAQGFYMLVPLTGLLTTPPHQQRTVCDE